MRIGQTEMELKEENDQHSCKHLVGVESTKDQ